MSEPAGETRLDLTRGVELMSRIRYYKRPDPRRGTGSGGCALGAPSGCMSRLDAPAVRSTTITDASTLLILYRCTQLSSRWEAGEMIRSHAEVSLA